MVAVIDNSSMVKKDTVRTITTKNNKPDTSIKVYGITANGNRIDTESKVIQVMGPDPYFNNVPKDQWPKSGETKLANTELFQSINPFFIVVLTPLLLAFFAWRTRKGKTVTTASKFAGR